MDDHAFGDRSGAADLQLGSFFDLHQTHAAGCFKGVVLQIAERGDFDAVLARDFDQKGAFLSLDGLAVDG